MEIRVVITDGSSGICSAVAIWERRDEVEVGSSGVKRNLEQRDARGSMILWPRRLKYPQCLLI